MRVCLTSALIMVVIGSVISADIGRADVSATALLSDPTQAANYAHPEWLVDSSWIANHRNDPDVRIVAVTPTEVFEAGHIPGAQKVDWPQLEVIDSSDASIEQWESDVIARLGKLGLTADQTIVIYDGGTLFAARLWWILDYFGHEDARILNGGLPAWTEGGGEIETGPPVQVTPAAYVVPGRNESRLTRRGEVAAMLGKPDVVLIDARAPRDYRAGHIPGAVNITRTDNALTTTSGYLKSAKDLFKVYADAGITRDTKVVAYSNEGVRSSIIYFSLRLLGYRHVSLYTSSWKDWIADPSLPITIGERA